jgi:hypothetical protein
MSVTKASHQHKTWTEVSAAPHLQHTGLSFSPIIQRSLHMVLCLITRPVITLACILLKGQYLSLNRRIMPQDQFLSLWVLFRSCPNVTCWLTSQNLTVFCISCLYIPRAGSDPTNWWTAAPQKTMYIVLILWYMHIKNKKKIIYLANKDTYCIFKKCCTSRTPF